VSFLQYASYLAAAFFVITVAAKMIRIARMPTHLRWEIYPIPREKGRSRYGGSYYEELDWWTKRPDVSRLNEAKEMALEILLLRSLFRHNRRLWLFSFPFHIGMYGLVAFFICLKLGALMQIGGLVISPESSSPAAVLMFHLTRLLAGIALPLSIIGGAGLLIERIGVRELRQASLPGDYVNLLILLAVFVSGLLSWLTADRGLAVMRTYVQSLITFSPSPALPSAHAVHLWLIILLLLYFPFTHMTHMFSKYFTYHRVRWDDRPSRPGEPRKDDISEALEQKLSWAAPHIKAGRSWSENAADEAETND